MQINLIFIILIQQIIITSPNRHFSAEIEYHPGTELITRSLTLKHDQTVCFVKESPHGATFFIDDLGSIFGIGTDALYFYDQQGNETLIQTLNAPNGFMFVPDYSLFFASDLDGLRAYNHDGSLKYTFPACRLFTSTDMADIVATVTAESLCVYNQGNRIYSAFLSNPYVWSIEVNEDKSVIRLQLPT